MSEYRLVGRIPSVEDYNRVRVAAGLNKKDAAAAEIGLANSVFSVCLEHDGVVVGIGRIVGDGALFFEIVDIAVIPDHQQNGFGAEIMDSLIAYLRRNAASGAFVSLISGYGVSRFYERYGFEVHSSEAPGMSLTTR